MANKAKANGAGLGAVRYIATKRTKTERTQPNRPRRKAYRGQGRR
jgi:hypothetical protein